MKKTNKLLSLLLGIAIFAMMIPMLAQAATLTTVTVKKTDTDGNPLAGAVFALRGIDNSRGTDYQAESGENGIAEFVDVADGEYELSEAMSPRGYVFSTKKYLISVNGGIVYFAEMSESDSSRPEYSPYQTVTYVNEKLPTYPVTVKKTDKNGNPIAGAVFTLTGTGNSIGNNYEATSAADGTATFNANDGFYKLAEKTAPQGYIKSDKTYDIVVSEGRISFVKETDNGTEYTDYETVVYVNERIAVTETPKPANTAKSPQTGNGNAALLIALLFVSGGAAAVCGKKYLNA